MLDVIIGIYKILKGVAIDMREWRQIASLNQSMECWNKKEIPRTVIIIRIKQNRYWIKKSNSFT